MGKRETSTLRTARRRLLGHVSTGPTGVLAQSNAAMSRPASPPAAKTSRAGPVGTAVTFTSRGRHDDATGRVPDRQPRRSRPAPATYLRVRRAGSEPLGHVVDAGREGGHVVGVDGWEQADPQLVAA